MSSETRHSSPHPSPLRNFLDHDTHPAYHNQQQAIDILVEHQQLRDQLIAKYSSSLDPKTLSRKLELLAQELKITTVRPFQTLTREQKLATIIHYLVAHKISIETLPIL